MKIGTGVTKQKCGGRSDCWRVVARADSGRTPDDGRTADGAQTDGGQRAYLRYTKQIHIPYIRYIERIIANTQIGFGVALGRAAPLFGMCGMYFILLYVVACYN